MLLSQIQTLYQLVYLFYVHTNISAPLRETKSKLAIDCAALAIDYTLV